MSRKNKRAQEASPITNKESNFNLVVHILDYLKGQGITLALVVTLALSGVTIYGNQRVYSAQTTEAIFALRESEKIAASERSYLKEMSAESKTQTKLFMQALEVNKEVVSHQTEVLQNLTDFMHKLDTKQTVLEHKLQKH